MQPVAIIPPLQALGEAPTAKLRVERLQTRQNSGKQGFYTERRRIRRQEVGNGCRGAGVDGVDADAEDDLVRAVAVAALGEDAADFDICL